VEAPQASNEKAYTNAIRAQSKAPTVGAAWWHKETFEQAYILFIGTDVLDPLDPVYVKFRTTGAPDVLNLETFLSRYQEKPPTPPIKIGEEWEDTQGNIVHVKTLDEAAAVVEDGQGRTYLLPYVQFHRWRKIERRSIYERLVDDPDDSV
jgi:hypothetical protein